jgi:hypothetical protein
MVMSKEKKEILPLNESQKKLAEDNIQLVDWFLKRTPKGVYSRDKEAYRQELMMSLVVAASTYDPSKGSFSGHAAWQMKGARSLWMHKKRYHKNVLDFKTTIVVEDDQSPEQFIVDKKRDDREIERFREALSSLSLQDRVYLPESKKMFLDYDKRLEYNGPDSNNMRIQLESESLLKLIAVFRDLSV